MNYVLNYCGIYSCHRYVPSACWVPGTVLGTTDNWGAKQTKTYAWQGSKEISHIICCFKGDRCYWKRIEQSKGGGGLWDT